MSIWIRCLAALVLATLTGCTMVGSVHPLSDGKTSLDDERLVGKWISLDPKTKAPSDEGGPITIQKAAAGKGYEAVNPNQEEQVPLYLAELGGRRFLSIVAKKENESAVAYLIVQYEVSDDQIRIYFLDPDLTADAINRGAIEGTVTRSNPSPDDPNEVPKIKEIVLRASTPELRKFFASKPGQAIVHSTEPAMILKRAVE